MDTRGSILKRLRKKRGAENVREVITMLDGVIVKDDISIYESYNAANVVKWLTKRFRELRGEKAYKKVPIEKTRKFILSRDSINDLISGEFSNVVEEYLKIVMNEVGTLTSGKDELLNHRKVMDGVYKNISSTINLERRIMEVSSQLCQYLSRMNRAIRETNICTEIDIGRYGGISIYNMTNCHTENKADYVNAFKCCLRQTAEYPKILLGSKKNNSIYYSQKRGLAACSKFFDHELLKKLSHGKTMQLMKDKYLVISYMSGHKCYVVDMEPLVAAIEESEIHYTYFIVYTLLNSELAERAKRVKNSIKTDVQEGLPAVYKNYNANTLRNVYSNVMNFMESVLAAIEKNILEKVKREYYVGYETPSRLS